MKWTGHEKREISLSGTRHPVICRIFSDRQIEELQKKRSDQDWVEEEKKGGNFLCRFCGNPITTLFMRISINGSHRHTCTNPSGVTYHIGCFSKAPGCFTQGTPTTEHTWFPGYSWNYSLCGRCGNHMGWFFSGREGRIFFGLIMANLLEERET